MRTMLMAVLSGAGLLAATVAYGDNAKPVTPTPVSTQGPVTCHAIVHEGTVVHRSECHTQQQWDRIRWQEQQQIRDMQQRGLTTNQ